MDENINDDASTEVVKEGSVLKKLLIAIPLFVVQLVAVYFITANFLISETHSSGRTGQNTSSEVNDPMVSNNTNPELGKNVYTLDDIIVNPAETDGKRLLLVSVGLDMPDKQQKDMLKDKEVIIKDRIITVLSSKRIDELNSPGYKDSLRIELAEDLNKMLAGHRINKIYFSKFIIQ